MAIPPRLAKFRRSLATPHPPAGYAPALQALWWAAKDDWKAAHDLVMAEDGAGSAWVHAHLHRVAGDRDNARYWYRAAGRRPATGAFDAEREVILAALIEPETKPSSRSL